MDHVVVDVEIQKTIEETPGGWDATDKLGVAVACVWEYSSQRMRIYGPEDVKALQDRLLKADRISGYNIWRFDFPVIWEFSRELWSSFATVASRVSYQLAPHTDDLLLRIWSAAGLNPNEFTDSHKIGYGGDAPKWFQAGQWARVTNYCSAAVALERDLCDFIDRYGYVLGPKGRLAIPPWKPESA